MNDPDYFRNEFRIIIRGSAKRQRPRSTLPNRYRVILHSICGTQVALAVTRELAEHQIRSLIAVESEAGGEVEELDDERHAI